ncbi:hypothetical protein GN956_G10113 [Arapaima gigas]
MNRAALVPLLTSKLVAGDRWVAISVCFDKGRSSGVHRNNCSKLAVSHKQSLCDLPLQSYFPGPSCLAGEQGQFVPHHSQMAGADKGEKGGSQGNP